MEHSQSHTSVPTVAPTSPPAIQTCVFFCPCRKRTQQSLKAAFQEQNPTATCSRNGWKLVGFSFEFVSSGEIEIKAADAVSLRLHQPTQNSQMFIQKQQHFSQHKKGRFGGLVSAKLSCTTSMPLPRSVLSLFNSLAGM